MINLKIIDQGRNKMNKYFTKEYAKLCENEKIQNLQFNYRDQDCYFNDTGPLIYI